MENACLSLTVKRLMTKTYFYVVWMELISDIFETWRRIAFGGLGGVEVKLWLNPCKETFTFVLPFFFWNSKIFLLLICLFFWHHKINPVNTPILTWIVWHTNLVAIAWMNQIPIAFLKSGECLSLRVNGLMTKTYFYVIWLELTSEIFETLENKCF